MCDYSLMHYPNRLAVNGDELVVHRFLSGSIGLASEADLHQTAEKRVTPFLVGGFKSMVFERGRALRNRGLRTTGRALGPS
jgi:hypothetical protein